MDDEKTNLFVYGSLRDPKIFESVSGFSFTFKSSEIDEKTLFAEPALLARHKKVSPDNVYFYAVASPSSRIDGFVIYDVPPLVLAEVDRYEGKRYDREIVHVNTAKGSVTACSYLVSHESMKKRFGDRFHVNLIHELWLRKRIEKFIEEHTRPGEQTLDAELERRAQRELLATTERDLVISHYGSDAVSDYYLEHELNRPRPSIKHLYEDSQTSPFVENYLELVIKQVLLNQLDEKIQSRYRFELEHMRTSERYFKRSISLLAALKMMNNSDKITEIVIDQAINSMRAKKGDLIDYVKYAINAMDNIFDPRVARSYIDQIRANFQPGLVPLGAELELSNLGYNTILSQNEKPKTCDLLYDGFRYFYDLRLDVLGWKLGAYIDDHTDSNDMARRPGFLELAPGRLNTAGELSRPATADPWTLNQLIHEILHFYNVKPHSLHLSFQLRKNQIGKQKTLPLGFVKCLFVLGGGLEQQQGGRWWVSRLGHEEITQNRYGEELVFARTSKRNWYLGEDGVADKPPVQAVTNIQQYKFIRLDRRANYEPLIMCLKGLQLSYNPGDYLTVDQIKNSPKLQGQYEELKKWAMDPTLISRQIVSRFLKTVQYGLMNERHHRPAHKLHYIDWCLSAIDIQLRMFNKQFKETTYT